MLQKVSAAIRYHKRFSISIKVIKEVQKVRQEFSTFSKIKLGMKSYPKSLSFWFHLHMT